MIQNVPSAQSKKVFSGTSALFVYPSYGHSSIKV